MILAIVFLPLLAAAIAGLGNKAIGATPAKLVTTGALFVSCLLSWPIFIGFLGGNTPATVHAGARLDPFRQHERRWALRVDTMTAVMLVVITTVSALVHLYSWGYMSEDPDSRASSPISASSHSPC